MMKKLGYLGIVLFLCLGLFSGCEKKPAEITVSSEPCIIEATSVPFTRDIIEPYVSIVAGDEKLAFEDLEIIGTVNSAVVGVYPLELKYTHNNKVAEATISVHVVDTEKPEIKVVDQEILLLLDGEEDLAPELNGISAYDGYDGLITSRITYTSTVDIHTAGSYKVEYTVSDTSGNSVSTSVNVRVTKSMDEYAKYLYDRAIKLYWGEYYQLNSKKEAPYDKEILNYETVMTALLGESLIQSFERNSGISGELNSAKSPIQITVEDGKLFLSSSAYEKKLDYVGTKLELVQKRENYVKYNAIISYGVNKDELTTEVTSFALRYIDGRWIVEEFTLPN